ncbi:MAG: hypothetical protein SFT92_09490 [Rickettsiales bacterium]|nr:hypothetical protein [Rickettsiales bacterium]
MRFGGGESSSNRTGENPTKHKILAAIEWHFLGTPLAHFLAHIKQRFADDRFIAVRIFRACFFYAHDSVVKRVLQHFVNMIRGQSFLVTTAISKPNLFAVFHHLRERIITRCVLFKHLAQQRCAVGINHNIAFAILALHMQIAHGRGADPLAAA